jgi:phosphoribosylglycinamide formyltransferase 2
MTQGEGEFVVEGAADDDPSRQGHKPPPAVRINPEDAHRIKVMLLGSDEYGRELAIAFARFGAEVIAVERYADAPAHRVADQSLVVEMTDTDELAALIGRWQPNYVVAVTGAVAADALNAAAETGFAQVCPTARSARLAADREGLRRLAAGELGLPTAPFWFAGSMEELRAVAGHAGYPLRVQPVTPAAGQGESVISGPRDAAAAWQRAVSAGNPLTGNRVLAETVVEVDVHVTLLTVRRDGPAGPVIEFCAPIGHRRAGSDLLESWQPQHMSPAATDAAKSIAARLVTALGGRGVFGVELMVRGDEVYFSDVSARPYERGLVTLRTQRLSVFELQARAILGLTTDTIMVSPGAAQVIYSAPRRVDSPGGVADALAQALAVPESDVRVFVRHRAPGDDEGRGQGRPEGRRPRGAAVVTAADVTTARERAGRVSAALRTFCGS